MPMPTGTPLSGSTVLPTGPLPDVGSSPSPSSGPTPTPVANSENAGAPALVEPPGKKLQVLPIGLGVFAGVSVIALLVVGIVTWERTKHRRVSLSRWSQMVTKSDDDPAHRTSGNSGFRKTGPGWGTAQRSKRFTGQGF